MVNHKNAKNHAKFQAIYDTAHDLGMASAEAKTPRPMVVAEHASPLDDKSPVRKQWVVSGGVCGFAWIVIKPGTSAFARWLKAQNYADPSYYGGVEIWVSLFGQFGQSMEKKEAYANGFVSYLKAKGIKAYAMSRMD